MPVAKDDLLRGEDKFGPFLLRVAFRYCDVCGCNNWVTVHYEKSASLPEGTRVEDTILGDWGGWVGVQCGCFAKFHRQVAHITDSVKARR